MESIRHQIENEYATYVDAAAEWMLSFDTPDEAQAALDAVDAEYDAAFVGWKDGDPMPHGLGDITGRRADLFDLLNNWDMRREWSRKQMTNLAAWTLSYATLAEAQRHFQKTEAITWEAYESMHYARDLNLSAHERTERINNYDNLKRFQTKLETLTENWDERRKWAREWMRNADAA